MTHRETLLSDFIASNGWHNCARTLVAGDASNRRYERLTRPGGESLILMDAPPEMGEDVRPFISVAQHLRTVGLSAPEIFHIDVEHGFLLIEDLGNDLFKTVIARAPKSEPMLYAAAIDVLSTLHASPPPPLAPYDARTMTDYAALAFDWYQFAATGNRTTGVQADFEATFCALLAPLDIGRHVLIQRDYHAENLLWLPDRSGPARVGLLDFQDAMLGHPAYDVVSLLQDARRDVTPQIEDEMIARYLRANPQDEDAFRAAYALLGVQRNLRIMGVFARLCLRDGKPRYLDFMPRVWAFVTRNLDHPTLGPIADLIHENLPAPTEEIRVAIRLKAAA